jgi:hypothetical protein
MSRLLSAPGGQRMIGGMMGDSAGAACEIAETAALLILSVRPLEGEGPAGASGFEKLPEKSIISCAPMPRVRAAANASAHGEQEIR